MTDAQTDFGSYKGKKRKPCPENPVALLGQPIGMYHCPYCGMMVIAGLPHPSPSAPPEHEQDPRYLLDDYEDEYGRPWPLGYQHASDCAVHSEPAFPAGPCDCELMHDDVDLEDLGSCECGCPSDKYDGHVCEDYG